MVQRQFRHGRRGHEVSVTPVGLTPEKAESVDFPPFPPYHNESRSGEVDVFAGPIYDNQGNEVVAEGDTIHEEDLFSVMYLVDNVIGTLD